MWTWFRWLVFRLRGSDPFAHLPSRGRKAGKWRRYWEISSRFGRGPTGGWGRPRKLAKGDIFLGRKPRSPQPVGFATERHMVTIGAPGSGKSSGALIPNLCFHEGSLLAVDVKGELAGITAARRGKGGNGVKGMGQAVHVLDPFGITGLKTASYNVFDEIAAVAAKDPDAPVSYAGKIAEALVKPMSEKEVYWDNSARTLIKGLILYIFQSGGERSLLQLRRLLMEGDFESWKRESPEAREGKSSFDFLFEAMTRVEPGPYRDTVVWAGSMMLAMPPNQMGGVLSTAQEHTSFLDAPQLARVSGASDFLLDDLKTKKISVYLCLPLNCVAGKESRWLRMFVVLFLDMMTRRQEAPKPPVLLALDEFPSLGRVEGIEAASATLRSFGVRLWLVAQDIPQLQAVYPQTWKSLLGNAEAVQFMGVHEAETVDFISKALGRRLVEGFGPGKQGPGFVVPSIEERPLLDQQQVALFLVPDLRNQIVIQGGRRPLKVKTTPYFEYLPARYYSPPAGF